MARPEPTITRRNLLAAAGAVGLVPASATATVTPTASPTGSNSSPDGSTGWGRTYGGRGDQRIDGVAPAHGGGWLLVGRDAGTEHATHRPWVVAVAPDGAPRWQRRLDVESTGLYDAVLTADGYVATGDRGLVAWLDRDGRLRRSTTTHPDYPLRRSTLLPLDEGFVLAGIEPTPETASTVLLGVAGDGTVHWRRTYQTEFSLSFLLPRDDGVLVGGWHLESGGPWLASLGPDGDERWFEVLTLPDWAVPADAVPDGDGLVLLGDSGLIRLDAYRTVAWRRTYDALADSYASGLARTADGGYVVVAIQAETQHVRLVKVGPDRSPEWTGVYGGTSAATDPQYGVAGLIEHAPGSYLVAGTVLRGGWNGWAALLGRSALETPVPATTVTRPSAESPPSTASFVHASPKERSRPATRTVTSSPGQSGFGVLAALAGLVGGAVARRRG